MINEQAFGESADYEDITNAGDVDTMTSETATEQTLEELLLEAQAEAARNLEGWQRTQAEFANARKRMERQQVEAYASAGADLVSKLLPIVDDFELALESAPTSVSRDGWFSGIELVHRKLHTILQGMDVHPIEAVGMEFDPNLHEALSQEPSDQYEQGVVTREMRRGYRMGERVIRPSLVVVAG